jgi:hypothetical protein
VIVSNTLNVKEILKIYLIEQYIDQSDLTLYVSYCTVLYTRVGRGEEGEKEGRRRGEGGEANKMVLSFHTIYKQKLYMCRCKLILSYNSKHNVYCLKST